MSSKSKEDSETRDPSQPPKAGEIIVVEELGKKPATMPAVPEGHSLSLLEMAVRRGDSLEMVTKLMDLQDRHDAKQAKNAFVTAMSLFKSEHLKIGKNKKADFALKTGGRSTYTYSTLDNILEVVVPVMSKYGLSATWDTNQEGDKIIVTCILTHSLGHSESVKLEAAPDNTGYKNPIQQVASSVKYLERYTFLAVTGLSVGDDVFDDDGHGGGSKTLSEEEIQVFVGRLGKCGTVKECDKVLADASKSCMKFNDLKSYKIIGTNYNQIKDLIENPPE